MKKIYSILILLLLVSYASFAQTKSIRTTNVKFKYGYRALPTEPLHPLRFSYAVLLDINPEHFTFKNERAFDNQFVIPGQIKVGDFNQADYVIEARFGEFYNKSANILRTGEVEKDKRGKESKSKKTTYVVEMRFQYSAEYRITKNGRLVNTSILQSPTTDIVYTSKEYKTREEAGIFLRENREKLINRYYQDAVNNALRRANLQLSQKYGFIPYQKVNGTVKSMKKKRHNENARFNNYTLQLVRELEKMTPDRSLDKKQLMGIINYYESLPAKSIIILNLKQTNALDILLGIILVKSIIT